MWVTYLTAALGITGLLLAWIGVQSLWQRYLPEASSSKRAIVSPCQTCRSLDQCDRYGLTNQTQ